MNEWQPIETAPKDGTYIDLWNEKRGRRYALARWVDLYDGWQYGESDVARHHEFSHWMPIPDGPNASFVGLPAVEVANRVTGHKWRVFADGRIEGFGENNLVLNRIPGLIHQACASVIHG